MLAAQFIEVVVRTSANEPAQVVSCALSRLVNEEAIHASRRSQGMLGRPKSA